MFKKIPSFFSFYSSFSPYCVIYTEQIKGMIQVFEFLKQTLAYAAFALLAKSLLNHDHVQKSLIMSLKTHGANIIFICIW